MTIQEKCRKLAEAMGCTLEKKRRTKHTIGITVWLPEGKQVEGNPGLDCLVNDGETMAEVWPAVLADLQDLRMEAADGRS
jgi:hypothetical protein